MKKVLILGATGSIGIQTIEACENLNCEIVGLVANTSYTKLISLKKRCNSKLIALSDETAIPSDDKTTRRGIDGIISVIRESKADIIVNAIVGSAGIIPTLEAIKNSKRVALANKETLVSAGKIIMEKAKEFNCEIIPIDSEHSAIFQCLQDNKNKEIKKIHLTASGGPFLNYTFENLKKVTKKQALKHPKWEMGAKISIDSSTLMNKGLEVIEAKWLFDVEATNINVVVHPNSIIHSMVEYVDNSIIAQMGAPDMRVPIQYSLTYPNRCKNDFDVLDLLSMGKLEFYKPDRKTFKCLNLAFDAIAEGKTMPCVLNAANEQAVELFLNDKIPYYRIWEIIENAMSKYNNIDASTIEEILLIDKITRDKILMEETKCQY